jgi:hypothetical protein
MKRCEALSSRSFLDRLIDLAVAKPARLQKQAVKPRLRKGEFFVYVDYEIPYFGELMKRHGDDVPIILDGRPFQKHASCAQVHEIPSYKIIAMKRFDRPISSEEAIAELGKLGYRPAIHSEAYAFLMANLDHGDDAFIALGSSTLNDDDIRVVLTIDDISNLNGEIVEGDWTTGNRFLAVRLNAPEPIRK